ncbi:serine hydrolase domain-containing protein [Paenibacillus methanolicus]|uniref:CubicO group peptidase (Beta-lactamase class C family) n=1 Tax=Paenibacillus methanolicus TaxID=582686 RepID=A0A5S5CHH2_9BACL|nr:serine hydrolase domain-containing protein [Paenibacillus methanolicus]TYP79210.1 CubicO group peptidase (beta-lactamase class C family) [Paenibacillus methanolicus]
MLGQTAIRQIKAALRAGIDNREVAGGNLLLIQDGQEAFYHEDGFADVEAGIPIARNSIFRLYSMTKPVTAAAVMILLERGLIDLLDPVSQYLPGFRDQRVAADGALVPVRRDMNIRDLLTMTSGLTYGGDHRAGRETASLFREIESELLGERPIGTVDAMSRLGQCALVFQPGASFAYGTSADVLGAIVEVASGMRFGDFLRQELFEPLGMRDTGFWLPENKRSRLAKTYADDGRGDLALYEGNHLGIVHHMDRDPAFESGGAGLASTIDDYARFATMLMNEGSLEGNRILRPKTVRHLASAGLTPSQRQTFNKDWHSLQGYSYGNLMRVLTDVGQGGGLGCEGEYGWDGWLGAYFCNCPAERLTFLFMIQKKDAGTTSLTRKLRNIVLGSRD